MLQDCTAWAMGNSASRLSLLDGAAESMVLDYTTYMVLESVSVCFLPESTTEGCSRNTEVVVSGSH